MCVSEREREKERKKEREIDRETEKGEAENRKEMLSMNSAVRSVVQASFFRIQRLSSVAYSVLLP